jgi:cephalosporin hydroxylase
MRITTSLWTLRINLQLHQHCPNTPNNYSVLGRPIIQYQHDMVAKGYERILVCLDSNHTHAHVLVELDAYAPLTSLDSYCVVFDTIVEDMPADMFPDRPWGARRQSENSGVEIPENLPRV